MGFKISFDIEVKIAWKQRHLTDESLASLYHQADVFGIIQTMAVRNNAINPAFVFAIKTQTGFGYSAFVGSGRSPFGSDIYCLPNDLYDFVEMINTHGFRARDKFGDLWIIPKRYAFKTVAKMRKLIHKKTTND